MMKMIEYSTAAIVMAAGKGHRMNSEVPKQYMGLVGKPVLYYCLRAFEESPVDEIVIVVGEGDEDYVRETIVEEYGFRKVSAIVVGGAERVDSVRCGVMSTGADIVLIHDGARPMIDIDTIVRCIEAAAEDGAAVAAVKAKDTIKIGGADSYVESTPDRTSVYIAQTPQAFKRELIVEAYEKRDELMAACEMPVAKGGLLEQSCACLREYVPTDDTMLVEDMTGVKAKLVEGSYKNIKITTPEDLIVAWSYMSQGEVSQGDGVSSSNIVQKSFK